MDAVPLDSLDALWEWEGRGERDDIAPLINYSPCEGTKLMLCHDMKGGYLPEESLSGCEVCPEQQPFIFTHWWNIDVFCYFTHHLVTIPPLVWLNAAHTHGVQVMGTLITEWEQGKEICARLLADDSSMVRTVDGLVAIAREWKMDGWLVNIENTIDSDRVPSLVRFVELLTAAMHAYRADSKVVWYDSVTADGALDWQNELNDKNECFFAACDGIYLNYNWTAAQLTASAERAGARSAHVYAGVDCFARGAADVELSQSLACLANPLSTVLPSSLNSAIQKKIRYWGWDCFRALAAAGEADLSVALFAPGWIAETMPAECPLGNANKFWDRLVPYVPNRPVRSLPFNTTFATGFSKDGKWFCGEAIGQHSHYAMAGLRLTKEGLEIEEAGCHSVLLLSLTLPAGTRVRVEADPAVERVVLNGEPIGSGGCESILSEAVEARWLGVDTRGHTVLKMIWIHEDE